MDDAHCALSQEIARILACTYPASLTTLADLLGQADDRTVQACIHSLPQCSIARLASIVIDVQERHHYSLFILHAFCQSSEFRNAALEAGPTLLDSLLKKANASEREFDEYTDLCVLLLSEPLPQHVPLPARVQPFFQHLLDQITQTSDHTSLKHLYHCLNGACRGFVKLLPPQVRRDLDERLYNLIHSHSASLESMQLIWCFGIAILSERPEVAGGVKNPSSNTATEWKSSSARKILGTPKQMRKCMELTSLTVINLLQEGSHVSERDTIEGVKIATRTMHLIDEDTKRDWSRASGLAKSAVSKVAEKILRPAISPDVQFACLCFYAAMAGDARLPEKILTRYDTLLLGLKERDSDPNTLRETLESSLTLYIPQMQESTLHQLLVKILEASGSSRPAELRNTGTLVKTLLNATTGPLPRLLASALCSTELQEPLQMFLRTDFESSLGRGDTCDTSTNHLKRNLYTNTISMLLASLLAAGAAQYDSAARIGLALLTKQRTLPPLNLQCSHPKPSRRPSISLFEQGCTPATGIQRQDWRDTLSSELERHSRYQTDSVIRLYAQISQNLEDRCNTAEEPLRQEQAKVKELTSVNAQLKRQVEDLETKVSDQETYLNVLEDEKYDLTAKMESLEADAKEAHQENNGLLVKLEELRGDFDRVNKEADESLRKAQEDLRAKEREFLSTMSAQEESLHSLDRHVGELSAQNEDFRNQVDALRAEKNSLDESYNTLQAEINALSRNLEDERDIRMRQAEETERLSAVQSNLEIQLATTKEKLEQSHNEFEDSEKKIAQLDATRSNLEGQLTRADQQLEAALSERLRERSELQAYIKEAEKALCDVEAKYANELDALKLKANDDLRRLQEQLQDAIKEGNLVKITCETTTQDLKLVQSVVDRLEEEVEQLTDACAEKDDELEKLKTWKAEMMAVAMGPSFAEPTSRRANRESRARKSSIAPVRQQPKRKSAMKSDDVARPKGTIDLQSFTSTALEDAANASFGSSESGERNGSTPKRAKTQLSLKSAGVRTPYKPKPKLARPSGIQEMHTRAALGAISPNRRHTTVGFALSKDGECDEGDLDTKRRGSLQFGTQASFDMNETLASSPFTPGKVMCGTGKDPEDEEAEDDTAEL